jgi:uncharacterized protein YqkB
MIKIITKLTIILIIFSFLPLKGQKNNNKLPKILSGKVNLEWVQHYSSGKDRNLDVPTAMITDKAGNIYVTGYCEFLPYGKEIVTIKYNSSGKLIWSVKYSDGKRSIPNAITIDNSGNVYITGDDFSTETYHDFITIKYNPYGKVIWVEKYSEANYYSYEIGKTIER